MVPSVEAWRLGMFRVDRRAAKENGPRNYLTPLSPQTFGTVRFDPSLLTVFQVATNASDPECALANELPSLFGISRK